MVFRSCILGKADPEYLPEKCFGDLRENMGLIEAEIEEKLNSTLAK